MSVLGVDPGGDGGFVLLDMEASSAEFLVTTTLDETINFKPIIEWLTIRKPIIKYCFLEHVSPIFRSAASSTFKFGRNFGQVEGILATMGIDYTLVRPKAWQKVVHDDNELVSKVPAKARSYNSMKKLYSKFSGEMIRLAGDQAKYEHNGLIDALLIAEYGRRLKLGDINGIRI